MITNERQLKVAEEKLSRLQEGLRAPVRKDIDPLFQEASSAELEELIQELRAEISEYLSLQKGGVEAIPLSTPTDMLLLPIRYRIAVHLTQEQFAHVVGVSLRQIARYESEEYQNISGDTLLKILKSLPLKIVGKFQSASVPSLKKGS